MSDAQVDTRSQTDKEPGASLMHTCALHPRKCDGPHHDGCYALCGYHPSMVSAANPLHVRGPDSCVVCDDLFDSMYRRVP